MEFPWSMFILALLLPAFAGLLWWRGRKRG